MLSPRYITKSSSPRNSRAISTQCARPSGSSCGMNVIEAPNWEPSGQSLLINGGGRLYRVPLDAPRMIPVDTGFAQSLNNDHGISPDGNSQR